MPGLVLRKLAALSEVDRRWADWRRANRSWCSCWFTRASRGRAGSRGRELESFPLKLVTFDQAARFLANYSGSVGQRSAYRVLRPARRPAVPHTLSVGMDRRLRWAFAVAAGLVLSVVLLNAAPAGAAGNGWTIVPSAQCQPVTAQQPCPHQLRDCLGLLGGGVGWNRVLQFDDAGRALERKCVVHRSNPESEHVDSERAQRRRLRQRCGLLGDWVGERHEYNGPDVGRTLERKCVVNRRHAEPELGQHPRWRRLCEQLGLLDGRARRGTDPGRTLERNGVGRRQHS